MRERVFVTPEEERACRRMPIYITPPNINYWQGTYEGDARFSLQQIARLAQIGADPETVTFVEVQMSAAFWLAPDRIMPWRRLACPIVRPHGERLLVISPYGRDKLVYPDGSLTRRKARGRRGLAS